MTKPHTAISSGATRQALSARPTFGLSHRIERFAFALCWLMLARWTPPQLRVWRIMILRAFGARIHHSATVYASARIWLPRNLKLMENACLGPGVNCYCMAPIVLEPNALVSQGAYLCAGTHDVEDHSFPLVTRPIRIGTGAWVAAEAFVGPGVSIGNGAVLGARAVTVKDLRADGIYAGNPARFIRNRTGH